MARSASPKRTKPRTARRAARMVFTGRNYALMGVAVALIVLGYALMLIDNATNANAVDSALSLYVAPLLLLAGYLGIIYAILWRPRPTDEASSTSD